MGLLSAHAGLAPQVAAFLTSLHTLDWNSLAGLLDVRSAASELARIREATGRALASSLPGRAYDTVVDWWETSKGKVDEWPVESLVHGDFWSGNIIVDDTLESLRGVIDFAEAHIGDPAEDFAALFHAGPPFTSEVLHAYSRQRPDVPLGSLVERVSWWWEIREFQGLARGLDADDGMQIEDTLVKLRIGPLFDARLAFSRVPVTAARCEATRRRHPPDGVGVQGVRRSSRASIRPCRRIPPAHDGDEAHAKTPSPERSNGW